MPIIALVVREMCWNYKQCDHNCIKKMHRNSLKKKCSNVPMLIFESVVIRDFIFFLLQHLWKEF